MHPSDNSKAKYYNALNMLYKGNYSKLQKCWDSFLDWKTAWNNENSSMDIEKEWQNLLDRKINLILENDETYPSLLREIPLPPFGIYVLGNLQYKDPAIAIVGTRSSTPEGKELAKNFARALSSAGVTVISGLAMGIDETAHKGTLETGQKTIAVLGTPLNYIYPRQNQKLAEKIISNDGAIISEFPLNQEYRPQNFLIRNRIISGLSRGTLIIEAPERSGALATARFAMEQNRELFIVPGPVTAANYKGSHLLIKDGAQLVTNPQDILDFFGLKSIDYIQKLDKDNTAQGIKIINALKNSSNLTVDKLQANLDIKVAELNILLATLTIKGIIKEINGKYYLNTN